MNNRSSVNESNLVTFSPDLASLNSLDKKPLITYPFDHLYACHSQKSEGGQSLTLDKNVEISTHCLLQSDKTLEEKDAEILSLKNQNKRLKELLVYHLDLIQQQNDTITNREKSEKLIQAGNVCGEVVLDELVVQPPSTPTVAQKLINPPLIHGPTTSTVTSASESLVAIPNPALGAHGGFNTLEELGLEPHPKASFLYNSPAEEARPFVHDLNFDIDTSDTFAGLQEYPIPTLEAPDPNCGLTPLGSEFMMINRPVKVVQEAPARHQVSEAPEPQPQEPNYPITTNSGMSETKNSKIRRNTVLSSLCRMKPKPEPSTIYDDEIYSVNKKATKTLNKYGKQSNATPTKSRRGRRGGRQSNTRQSNSGQINTSPLPGYPYSGSLSDRLQLIDTTPTGEDPYQIGEAEMREQSPIPRLVLPTRVRAHTAELSTATSRRIYDPEPERAESPADSKPKKNKRAPKAKTNQRKSANAQLSTTSSVKSTAKSQKRKKEDVDWEPYTKKPKQTSLTDFSYGEMALKLPAPSGELVTSKKLPSATLISNSKLDLYTSCNLDKMQDISKMSYNEIFDTEMPDDEEDLDVVEPALEAQAVEPVEVEEPIPTPTKKRGARTTSQAGSSTGGEEANADDRRDAKSKRGGRKRALSSASTTKREKAPRKPRAGRGRGGYRGRRGSNLPAPPLTTREPYHTAMGNADGSWYLGHDPDIKKEDLDQVAEDSSNVEVPRWRQMNFTSKEPIDSVEKTEDDTFQKRHHKLETEERRQLRWHMRRVREQRHVEKLRLRQRNPLIISTLHNPPIYSLWPSPLRDLQYIEITDILPVLAFGENIPLLPENDFSVPWVNVDQAQKITKRSETLH